ncbi:TPA: GNAT family N-acetyltransferase [Streptococcus suis]|uniref:GNAT family N-acetyltransferase n=1 Tax=Streptococcus suis TaxID=1307 RepID=UPI001551D340|nr:GNAT family N-acetyltransferase [Streptococcus suis]MDY7594677.1 GNAT family N-acetyltransferase [Streptococcus suis]NQJ47320.1 GNAT family N-acetyltransferase [Streptococcus suis]NQJ53919.1 GNAT family N-acetyltransferase [Streptococcus suis]HEL2254152.1 GNAT family N-acetyltransferase [Streptococcus suis]HEL2405517.1 GNAT family N-acetyltransferase [Streptococcus suis]
MQHIGTQILETERLILRPFQASDVEPVFQNWTSDEKVTTYLTWPTHQTLQDTEDYVQFCLQSYSQEKTYRWVIELKENQQPIGDISVVSLDERVQAAELGWVLGSKWWGQGYMPEALEAVTHFLLEEVGCLRITAVHDSENRPSGRVMEKVGMTYEGTLRQAARNNRGFVDIAVYSLLHSDRKSR